MFFEQNLVDLSFYIKFAAKIRNRSDRSIIDILLIMNTKNTLAAESLKASFSRCCRIVCACVLFLSCVGFVDGQDTGKPQILEELAKHDRKSGQIELIQPVQVDNLLKLNIANNNLQKGIPGYQIRIFSQSGQTARQKATDARASFMRNFPEMDARMEYNDPNFQILVGNFRTYTEAYHEKKKIEKVFPGAFIVSEIIEIPK